MKQIWYFNLNFKQLKDIFFSFHIFVFSMSSKSGIMFFLLIIRGGRPSSYLRTVVTWKGESCLRLLSRDWRFGEREKDLQVVVTLPASTRAKLLENKNHENFDKTGITHCSMLRKGWVSDKFCRFLVNIYMWENVEKRIQACGHGRR